MVREVCTEALLGEFLLEAAYCFLEKDCIVHRGSQTFQLAYHKM
jgi:hypothetical protein